MSEAFRRRSKIFTGIKANQVWLRKKVLTPGIDAILVLDVGYYWMVPVVRVKTFNSKGNKESGYIFYVQPKKFRELYHKCLGCRKPDLSAGVTFLQIIEGKEKGLKLKVWSIHDGYCMAYPWDMRKNKPKKGYQKRKISTRYSFWPKYKIIKSKKK